MPLSHLKDDPALKVLRPLVEAYLAYWREDNRHIRSLKLTPSQFDVIATLGDTGGMTCTEFSEATLVTKGTLTGMLDRLAAKGLIKREAVSGDGGAPESHSPKRATPCSATCARPISRTFAPSLHGPSAGRTRNR
jgi:hypothetical protein